MLHRDYFYAKKGRQSKIFVCLYIKKTPKKDAIVSNGGKIFVYPKDAKKGRQSKIFVYLYIEKTPKKDARVSEGSNFTVYCY